jgi:hypothetical protein
MPQCWFLVLGVFYLTPQERDSSLAHSCLRRRCHLQRR